MTPRRARALAAVWTVPTGVFLILVHLVMAHYRIEVPPRLSDDAHAAIMARLRAAFEGRDATLPDLPELHRALPDQGPIAVQVWLGGAMLGRVDAYGATIADAVDNAATGLARSKDLSGFSPEQKSAARIKVDVVVGRGDLERRFPLLELVSLHPGVDGLGISVDGDQQILLPDELIQLGMLSKTRPFAWVPDFALGLDDVKLDDFFARRLGMTGKAFAAKDPSYFRIRTDSFIEPPGGGTPLPLDRGVPPGPPPDSAHLRTAALAGARYLVDHLGADGRYQYEINLNTGTLKSGYSIPRHAGATYFLAQAYRITHEEWLREPIERAFAHLQKLIDAGGCTGTYPDGEEWACVTDQGQGITDLGSSALAVVALAEYQRATGAQTYEPMAKKLAAWILHMQRDDGSFRHQFDIRKGQADEHAQLLYYSGEATLALARMYAVTQDERYVHAAEKGLDWLVGWYDFFAGGYLYGEEHWTCISAEALYPAVVKQKYLDFCEGYAAFLKDQQAEFPSQEDLYGAYNLTPFVMPSNTPAGSRTEAIISTYQLGVEMGQPKPEILDEILTAERYVLRQQIRPESDYAVAAKAKGDGGIPDTPADPSVRIDYVQHTCSSMIRASELVE